MTDEEINARVEALQASDSNDAEIDGLTEIVRDLQGEREVLREALADYAQHAAWRCDYRTRYGSCQCGLDELMTKLGLELVPPNDPEAGG